MNRGTFGETDISMFDSIRRKPIRVSQGALVTTSLQPAEQFPLVLTPTVNDLNLTAWAANNLEFVETLLQRHGALLFRGFGVDTVSQFEQFTRAISGDLITYSERSSPRTNVTAGVYTSTDHPADQHILLHNEQSYTLQWPMKIWFYCVEPAARGGRTPVADSREVLKRLNAELLERFARKGVMYVRNYGDGFGLPWQQVFQTNLRSEVEQYCRQAKIECEWKQENRLRTRQVRPAVRTHPKTGEAVWFNHAVFFHISSLQDSTRESMLAVISEVDLPFDTLYGDGSPIESAVLDEIRAAYRQETTAFSWQRQDILMLDNMLVAHGREPFAGPRQVVVAMAEPCTGD
jgi:alpha-ketoglutarate-dependent taurine dioxygenase